MSLAALSAVLLLNLPLVANAQTLINGANETGTILATTTNSYTFTANAGDSINLRLGSPGFAGNLELLGPTGAVLGTSGDNSTDHLIAYRATNSGTFTVLVSSSMAASIPEAPALTCCIWPRFRSLSLCRRVMKAGR